MATKIVFFDIAGEDDQALRNFYSEVFGWAFSADGQCSVEARGTSLHGAIRRDPKEKRLYLGVADVAETLAKIEARGGTIDQPRFEVPGLVILGLFKDPAGNEMGLVEMEGDEIAVPQSLAGSRLTGRSSGRRRTARRGTPGARRAAPSSPPP